MTATQLNGTEQIYKKTLLHSRLPKHIFHNFKINVLRNEDGSINNTRYAQVPAENSKPDLRLHVDEWRSLLGEEAVRGQLNFHDSRLNSPDAEGDSKMTGDVPDNVADDAFEPFLDQEIKHVTIMVCHDTLSIDNGIPINLPFEVQSAGVLKATTISQEDTLVLHLRSSFMLIRFLVGKEGQFEFHAVYSYEINEPDHSILSISSNSDSLALSILGWCVKWYTISYDVNGLPILEHIGNNLCVFSIVGQCMIPVTDLTDTLVTYSLRGGILYMNSIAGSHLKSTTHETAMKNSFPIPIHVIGLPDTRGVLLLQENQYTIQSLGFCLSGDESGNYIFEYPEIPGGKFKVNSFYIPQKKITTSFSIENFSEESYKHDQVLISTIHNNSIYVLDIYYDKLRHIFTSTMNRLFKYKQVVSTFIFEPVSDSTFRFTFANEMGISESKLVSIVTENDIPILKKVVEYWSEINPYPMLDFQLIESLGVKSSIENSSFDLWAIAGTDCNHSIMNFKFGLIAKKRRTNQKWHTMDRLYSFQQKREDHTYVWASGNSGSILFRIENTSEGSDDFTSFVHEQSFDERILSLSSFGESSQLIVTPTNIFLFDTVTFSMTLHLKLPRMCLLATSFEDLIAIIYEEEDATDIKFVMFKLSVDLNLKQIELKNFNFELTLVSMMQFYQISGTTYFMVGDFDGYCSIFQSAKDESFTFVNKQKLKMIPHKQFCERGVLLSEYTFVPYKLHQIDTTDNFILTSRNGDYILINISGERSLINTLQFVKLGDTGQVEIMPSGDPNVVYLSCANLWKLDLEVSSFPEKIVVDGLREHAVVACTALPKWKGSQTDQLIAIRGVSLFSLEIPTSPSVLIKNKKLETQCMKMKYYSNLDVFVLLPIPDPTDLEGPKLVFVESRTMKVLETGTKTSDIFRREEIPLSLHIWKVHETSGTYTNLVIGCKTQTGKGVLKVLRLNKENGKVYMRLVFSFKEDHPITHIDSFSQSRCLLYSSGKMIIRWLYSLVDSKLVERKAILETPDTIKRFTLKEVESGNPTSEDFTILALIKNNGMVYAKFNTVSFDPVLTKEQLVNEYSSDGLVCGDDILVRSDYNEESVYVTTIQEDPSLPPRKIDLAYIPRLCYLNSHPPWVSFKDRCESEGKQFITVGLNGQIDLFKFGKSGTRPSMREKYGIDSKSLWWLDYVNLNKVCGGNIPKIRKPPINKVPGSYEAADDAFVNNVII